MKFHRSTDRTSILLDLTDSVPTQLQIDTLLVKASAAGLWDALVRVRKDFECHDVFNDGWWCESTDGDWVILKKSIGIRAQEQR
jgi:hypothetical protein